MLVHHTVRDFGKWKQFFDQHEGTRKTSGSKSARVFQSIENPSDVFVLLEWDTIENLRKFGASAELKTRMEQAGVIGHPHVHTINEVQKYQA